MSAVTMKHVVVFYDDHFPYAGERPDPAAITQLQESCRVVGAEQLSEVLTDEGVDALVHLHGPYFPKDAWVSILAFLRKGKGLVSLGGAPFKSPVYRNDSNRWIAETEQTAYHQQLRIQEALSVDPAPIARLVHHRDIPLFSGQESLFTIEPTYGLVLHATRVSDLPKENGSSGPMDAHIYPLLKGINGRSAVEREVAAPAVLLENTKGEFAGGRWVLVNQTLRNVFWEKGGATALGEWANYTAQGVTELWLKPNYASYMPGEKVLWTIQWQRLGPRREEPVEWSLSLSVSKAERLGQAPSVVWKTELKITAGRELGLHRCVMPEVLETGLYLAECTAVSASGEQRILRQGIWGLDHELLRQGEPLTCYRDYFWKNGRPLPIVGMTYMTSDVARKFLQLPNAAVWDRDMAQMKKAGINLIRTGIWTAWRQLMFIDGHPNEEMLRAIDAFLLTAKRHDLEVTFNFFAFTPEAWEGVNPYLDPRSVEAQKRFIAAIVTRHAESTHVHWDLINEPSMFDPNRIFSGPRSCQDRHEREAFVQWLTQRHESIRVLQERWNMTPEELPSFQAARLPEPGSINFNPTESSSKKGGPWLDYTLFTMDMHNRWAGQLIDTIRSLAPKQLVTVGQDEGLGAQRPSPFFYADVVDYTTVHSWWRNDDLVWDSVFAKTPDKPCLVQETGIMYVETPDGRAKRSEFELRNILERKYAYAFSTGGAGAVQWIWNINYYMNNINESHIGALRADGTEKPEADVSYDFGAFMSEIRDLFVGRELEETVIIFPYSNDFSNRKFASEATSRLVRILSYELNIHVCGLGEYQLQSLDVWKPKLIIVPSPHTMNSEALNRLVAHVTKNGGTLFISGPLQLDEYWHPVNRLTEEIGVQTAACNLLREEPLELDGRQLMFSFGAHLATGNKQKIRTESRSHGFAETSKLIERPLGKGRLLWCPLPVEINSRVESLKAVYEYVLACGNVKPELEWLSGGELPGIYGRKLSFRGGALFIFVSEYGAPVEVTVRNPDIGISYTFMLESERSVLFATNKQGDLLAVYRPDEVKISKFNN